jgi:hypothetical protein
MVNSPRSFLESAARIWSGLLGREPDGADGRIHGVILHDPDAQKPKDLDNPFYDAGSQERIGALIAQSTLPTDRKNPE